LIRRSKRWEPFHRNSPMTDMTESNKRKGNYGRFGLGLYFRGTRTAAPHHERWVLWKARR
jgi:hypothetical protein